MNTKIKISERGDRIGDNKMEGDRDTSWPSGRGKHNPSFKDLVLVCRFQNGGRGFKTHYIVKRSAVHRLPRHETTQICDLVPSKDGPISVFPALLQSTIAEIKQRCSKTDKVNLYLNKVLVYGTIAVIGYAPHWLRVNS